MASSATATLPGTTGSFSHEALLYSGPDGFLAGTLPFIRQGLEAGEPVLVAAPADRVARLQAELAEKGDNVGFLDMAEVGRNPGRIISEWRDFIAGSLAAGRPVRGVGEPVWAGRDDEELVECARHEALLNVAFEDSPPWRLLCPYDVDALDGATVAQACRTHPTLWEEGVARESHAYLDPCSALEHLEGELAAPPVDTDPIEFGPRDVGLVRRLIADRARRAGVPVERAHDLVLAVSEIASNSVLHGGGEGALLVWQQGPELVCQLSDRGRIGDPLAGRRRPPPEELRGRGLWLAHELCDLVQMRTGSDGTVVRLRLRTDRPVNTD